MKIYAKSVWHSCDSATLVYYESHLDNLLQYVNIPHEALIGNSNCEDDIS